MGRSKSDQFYHKIASYTFGHRVTLHDFNRIGEVLVSICRREAELDETPEHVFKTLNARSDASCDITAEKEQNFKADNVPGRLEMQCDLCKKAKPPDEFPLDTVSESCEHYPGVCFRCVVDYVHKNKTCPQPNCQVEVDQSSERVKYCHAALARMFIDYSVVYEENRRKMVSAVGNKITVFSISGDTAWIDYTPELTVPELMKEVEEQTKIKTSNQKIMYNDQRLRPYKTPTKPYLLSDYGIKQHESLTLIVPLFCIPEDLDCVVFDLSWEFPKKNPDFLDASCLAFENRDFLQVIDWNHPENDFYLKGAIKHTHEITYGGQEGHQTINVSLKALPTYVSGLYFVLSSWKSPNLSAFSNPSLKFYPESQPENNLCKTTFTHALNSQAVIMCSVVRQNERWLIFDSDEDCCVNGNSKMYNPIRKQIEKLIAKDE
ncbi:uncharacterized protein LOC128554287 [Mercenaria mercenaria]|uniref:uncharacterized protein LOC128554287 n=1 Tax=Mercenaria mercenaria TaxID=6596 RepID=UPI00234FAAD5|nr:uncharacterized protein LOC128554287 [Mercenaria mercenaria]